MNYGVDLAFTSKAMACRACAELLKGQPAELRVVPADRLGGHHIFTVAEAPLPNDFSKARLVALCDRERPAMPWLPFTLSYIVDIELVKGAMTDGGLGGEIIQIEANAVGAFLDAIGAEW
jgi:hypothetical protein